MSLSPDFLSAHLRRMASVIDASKRPSKVLVARELRRVLAAMGNKSKDGRTELTSCEYVPAEESDFGALTFKIVGLSGITNDLKSDVVQDGASQGFEFAGTVTMDWPEGRDLELGNIGMAGEVFDSLDPSVQDELTEAIPYLVSRTPAWAEAAAQQGFDPSPIP